MASSAPQSSPCTCRGISRLHSPPARVRWAGEPGARGRPAVVVLGVALRCADRTLAPSGQTVGIVRTASSSTFVAARAWWWHARPRCSVAACSQWGGAWGSAAERGKRTLSVRRGSQTGDWNFQPLTHFPVHKQPNRRCAAGRWAAQDGDRQARRSRAPSYPVLALLRTFKITRPQIFQMRKFTPPQTETTRPEGRVGQLTRALLCGGSSGAPAAPRIPRGPRALAARAAAFLRSVGLTTAALVWAAGLCPTSWNMVAVLSNERCSLRGVQAPCSPRAQSALRWLLDANNPR